MKVCDERFDSLFFSSSRDQTRENGHRPLTRMKHQLVDHRTSIHPGAPGLRAQQSQWDRAVSHLYTIWKGAEGGLFFLTSCFFFFWLHWVSIAVCGLSQVTVSGGYFVLWCAGFSLRWLPSLGAQALGHAGSVAAAPRP